MFAQHDTDVSWCTLAMGACAGGRVDIAADETRKALTYMTMPGILEAPRGGNAYAFVTAYTDGSVRVDGSGTARWLSDGAR